MAFDRNLPAVPPQSFTSDGSIEGQVTIAVPELFKVRQTVVLGSGTQPSLQLQVKRVVDTVLFVGPVDNDLASRKDISAYLVADSAEIFAIEQQRPMIVDGQGYTLEDLEHEEEPTDARRAILVDAAGRKIDSDIVGGKRALVVAATFGGTINPDVTDRPERKLGQVFVRKPDDSVNLGDGANPIRVDPTGTTTQPVDLVGTVALDTVVTDSTLAPLVRAVAAGKLPTSGPQSVSPYVNAQVSGLSPTMGWRPDTPNVLDPNHVFDSSFELTEGYAAITLFLVGVPNTPGDTFQEMYFEVSDDGVTPVMLAPATPLIISVAMPSTPGPTTFIVVTLPLVGRYWRLHWKGPGSGMVTTYGDVIKTVTPAHGSVGNITPGTGENGGTTGKDALAQVCVAINRFWDIVSTQYVDVQVVSPLPVDPQGKNVEVEYDGSGNAIYVGEAPPGTATSVAKWRIKNITYDGSGNVLSVMWADGTSIFGKVWDNRAGYSYS